VTVRSLAILALVCAGTLSAQDTKAPATKTPATKTQAPATKAPAPATKTPAAATKGAPAQGTKTTPQQRAGMTVTPEAAQRPQLPVIMREVFEYASDARRDPFISLLMSAELRPTVADLRLVGVLYDESGRRPVAIMRDILTNTQYRVTTGMTLGRLRVALIKRRSVIFNIEEFGLNRQDSLILGDTTKVRAR
jgi:hypothetical protein